MVNWYFPLYLGVIFLLFLFSYLGSHSNVKSYLVGTRGSLGLSMGTNMLLAHLISGDAILFAIIAVANLGILGGIGFTLVELVSLLCFAGVVAASRKGHPPNKSILEVFANRLGSYGYKLLLFALGICCLGNMILQLLVLKYLLGNTLAYSFLLAIGLVSIFCLIWAGLGGFGALSKGAKPQILFVFFTTVLVTISIFLEKGIRLTYNDLSRVELIPLSQGTILLLLITGIIFRSARYLLDNSLWHTTYQIRPHRLTGVLVLSIFCYLAIPLAFGAVTVFSLSQGINYYQGNVVVVLRNLNFFFLLDLYVTTIFIAVISTYAINLYGLVVIYLNLRKKDNSQNLEEETIIKRAYSFALAMVLLCVAVTLLVKHLLVNYLIVLGLIYASLLIPVLQLILFPFSNNNSLILVSLIAFILGCVVSYLGYWGYAPLLTFCFSLSFTVFLFLIRKLLKIL